MKIARAIMALSFLLGWNVASVHRDAVVAAQSAGNRTITREFIVDPPCWASRIPDWWRRLRLAPRPSICAAPTAFDGLTNA